MITDHVNTLRALIFASINFCGIYFCYSVTPEMSYFAEFIFANCCINSQIKELTFLMKGFCIFSSSNVSFHYKKT